MRIAFVSQPIDGLFPPPQNSIGIVLYELARNLAGRADVTVFTAGPRFRIGRSVDQEVEYRHVGLGLDRRTERIFQRLHRSSDPRRPFYSSAAYYPFWIRRIAQTIRRGGFDIVHIVNNSQFVPPIRALNPGIKIVLHMECEWLNQLDSDLLRPRLAQTDLIVGCSQFITLQIQKTFPEFHEKCVTVYNGVDVAQFSPGDRRSSDESANHASKAVFIGRVSPEKGVHVLIDAFQQVASRHPDASLEIVGPVSSVPREFVMGVSDDPIVDSLQDFYIDGDPGCYERHLRKKIEGYRVGHKVHLRGSVPNDLLKDILDTADLFVFAPVWHEPFGIPPIEAMASGLPVVGSRSGAISETVVHGDTGLLVERNDPDQLASALIRMLENPAKARAMGMRGRQRVIEHFTYESVSTCLFDHYLKLLKTRRR